MIYAGSLPGEIGARNNRIVIIRFVVGYLLHDVLGFEDRIGHVFFKQWTCNHSLIAEGNSENTRKNNTNTSVRHEMDSSLPVACKTTTFIAPIFHRRGRT